MDHPFSIFSSLILLLLTTGCSSQFRIDPMDLHDFDMSIDVDSYYQSEIRLTEEWMEFAYGPEAKRPIADEDIPEQFFGVKDIRVDTIFTIDPDTYRPTSEIVGISYDQWSSSTGDRIAFYDELVFHELDMLRHDNGDFMAVAAVGYSPDSTAYRRVLTDLSDEHGTPEIMVEDFFGEYTLYIWRIDDRVIQFMCQYEEHEGGVVIQLGGEEAPESVEIEATVSSRLMIINNTYYPGLAKKLQSGNWLFIE